MGLLFLYCLFARMSNGSDDWLVVRSSRVVSAKVCVSSSSVCIIQLFCLVWALLVPVGCVLSTGVVCARVYGVCSFKWCKFCLCLFFQLVWVMPVHIKSVDVAGRAVHGPAALGSAALLPILQAAIFSTWAAVITEDGWPGEG